MTTVTRMKTERETERWRWEKGALLLQAIAWRTARQLEMQTHTQTHTHAYRKKEEEKEEIGALGRKQGLHFLSPNLLWQLFPWE